MNIVRSHWKIESMDWTLDVVLGEDKIVMYKGNISANMALVRRFVFNTINTMKDKHENRPKLMNMIG